MQLVVFIVIALGAAGAAEALVLAQPAAFVRYFGIFPPLAVFGVASAAGALAVAFAQLTVYKPGVALAQRARLAGAALLLVLPIVAFDAVVRLPEGVAFPASLLFYPAMGFVAEVLFHLVPLALLHRVPFRLAAPAIVLIEPLYQLTALTGATLPLWAVVYVGLQVTAVSTLQLVAYRRIDVVAMLSVRMAYYAGWHIAWGALR